MAERKTAGEKAGKAAAKKTATKKGATNKGAGGGASFEVGDRVAWDSAGGTAHGKVVRVATSPGKIKGFEYKASADDPRYVVETDEGKHAAHKAAELRKA